MPSSLREHPVGIQPNADGRGLWLQRLLRARHNRWVRLILSVLAVLIVAASGYYVVTKLLASLRIIAQTGLSLRPWPVFLSLVVVLTCVLLGGLIWHLVLTGIGGKIALRGSSSAHLLANLAGYLPGYGWKYLGKGFLVSRRGVPAGLATLAVLVEFIALAVTRAAITATFMAPALWRQYTSGAGVLWLWLLRLVTWLAVLALPLLLRLLISKRAGDVGVETVHIYLSKLWLSEALMCVVWMLVGIGFAVLLNSVTVFSIASVLASIFATTASYLVSLLAFFVPGGFGVRESVIIVTLTGVLPEGVSTLTAVISRVVLIVAELLGALAGLILRGKPSMPGVPRGDA